MAVKFFGKEEASQDGKNQGTSREVALRQSLPEGSQGTIRKEIPTQSESPPSPYSKSHKDPAQESTSAHNVEVVGSLAAQTLKDGVPSNSPQEQPKLPPKENNGDRSKQSAGIQAPPKIHADAIAAGVGILNAPAADTLKAAKGTSWTKQVSSKMKKKCLCSWIPKSQCTMQIFGRKHTLSSLRVRSIKSCSSNMRSFLRRRRSTRHGMELSEKKEASVQEQINVMEQKQCVLQWDKKDIVARDQAERIVKFMQTFSNLGSAIAAIDPVHAGIPCRSCTILTLILNDSTQHQDALNGLEDISTIVGKYIAIEDAYSVFRSQPYLGEQCCV